MTIMLLMLAIFAVSVLLNGLFAGYETGFVSIDRIRIRYLSEEGNDPRAASLMHHLANPDTMLTTVLVGTNIFLIVGTMAITHQLHNQWLAILVATPVFLVFAEVVPKSVFRRHPNRLSLAFLPVIRVFEILLVPFVYPTTVCLRIMHRVTGSEGQQLNPIMTTLEDLRHLIDESAARGSIEPEEQEMIHSVMDLQTISAKEIMVPRIDIEALPHTSTRTELIELFEKSGRTRIPIYRDSIDTIIGVANVYDVLQDSQPDNEDITRFAEEVLHVPDTVPLADLLQELKKSPQHLAIVTDEYGGTDGLITLEDVLEEIFGEIQDEHDRERDLIQQVGPNAFVVDARMPLEDLAEEVGFGITDDDVETVGGWVMHAAGRIPAQGEKLKHHGFRITILEGKTNQVSKIRLDILPEKRQEINGEPTDSENGL